MATNGKQLSAAEVFWILLLFSVPWTIKDIMLGLFFTATVAGS
jgi:hypothetical protein